MNWLDVDVLSDAGVNWIDLDVMSDMGVNWIDLDVMHDAGINWLDVDVLSDAGVNWVDLHVMSDMAALTLLPAASPVAIAVESRTNRTNNAVVPEPPVPVIEANTKTLELDDLGVMLADNPVTSVNVELVVVNVSVFVVLVTGKTVPFVGVVAATYRHADPFQIANIAVS